MEAQGSRACIGFKMERLLECTRWHVKAGGTEANGGPAFGGVLGGKDEWVEETAGCGPGQSGWRQALYGRGWRVEVSVAQDGRRCRQFQAAQVRAKMRMAICYEPAVGMDSGVIWWRRGVCKMQDARGVLCLPSAADAIQWTGMQACLMLACWAIAIN